LVEPIVVIAEAHTLALRSQARDARTATGRAQPLGRGERDPNDLAPSLESHDVVDTERERMLGGPDVGVLRVVWHWDPRAYGACL
jgi:hypothetical protein